MSNIRVGIVGLHNHYHAYPFADQLTKGVEGMTLVAVADERAELAEALGISTAAGTGPPTTRP